MSEAVAWRYTGERRWMAVPARDITAEEFERMPADRRRIILHSGDWTPVEPASEPVDEYDEEEGE